MVLPPWDRQESIQQFHFSKKKSIWLSLIHILPFKTIEELRDIAYSIVGEPEKVKFGDRVVGIIEARDGTIMDVVRQIKPYEFDNESK